MSSFVMSRCAALVGIGAFTSAGLSGCNTTPTPAIQSTPSGFRIGSIEVNTAPLLAQSGDPTASWAQQALPGQLARVFGAYMAQGAPGATLNARINFDLSRVGWVRQPRHDQGRRDAERRRRSGPRDNRACDRDILSGHGATRAAGAGLPGPGDGAHAGLRVQAQEEIGSLRRRQSKVHRFPSCAETCSLRRTLGGRPDDSLYERLTAQDRIRRPRDLGERVRRALSDDTPERQQVGPIGQLERPPRVLLHHQNAHGAFLDDLGRARRTIRPRSAAPARATAHQAAAATVWPSGRARPPPSAARRRSERGLPDRGAGPGGETARTRA